MATIEGDHDQPEGVAPDHAAGQSVVATKAPTSSSATSSHYGIDRDEIYKQFRTFEANRRVRRDSHGLIPRLHDQQIQKLSAASAKARWQLFLESETMRKKTLASSMEQAEALHEQAEQYGRLVKDEVGRLGALAAQLRALDRDLAQRRSAIGGYDVEGKRNRKLERRIKNHENLLDKALVKFNEASNSNQQLKDSIDFLRRERLVFDGVQEKLLREIRDKSKTTSAMLARSAAYEGEADAFAAQMIAMKGQVDQEFRVLERAWHEIAHLMRDNEATIDAIDVAQDADAQGRSALGAVHDAKERELRARLDQADARIGAHRDAIRAASARLEGQRGAVDEIRRATSIDDLDQLVDSFLRTEAENFHLYNRVGVLQDAIEQVEEAIGEAAGELARCRLVGKDNPNDSGSARMVRALLAKERAARADHAEHERRRDDAIGQLQRACDAIGELGARLDLARGTPMQIIAASGVSEQTIAAFLAEIEQDVVGLLDQYVAQRPDTHAAGALIRPIDHYDVQVEPPSIAIDDESDDDEAAAASTTAPPPATTAADDAGGADAKRTPAGSGGGAGRTGPKRAAKAVAAH